MTTTRTARWIARALVLALLNPGFSLQALARDTDIYVNLNTSGISPPNVLLVLDTSDSMNTADDWREYPGAYDSHVEYLWNSTSIISAYPGSPTHGENASLIALGMAPISSISYSGTTATVTATAHGFSAGWAVTIANASESVYNGQFTITSVVDADTFTYTLPSAPAAAASTQTILASGKTVTSLTRSGSTVTATVTAHGFSTGNSVVIENASDAYYNGTFSITVTGANTFTYTISGSPASPATALSMYAASRNPDATSKYGFWGGKSPAEKRALWQAAYTYATGTESGDPGARSTYRNYDNANWIHWLPAGSAETDPRLRSVSFNRWAGGVKEISGLRGGITWASNDFRQYNKCSASLADLLPSTVFAPTTYPLNAGKYLNQRWMRWERFLDLATVNLASYPGVTVNGNSTLDAGTFRTGYVGWPANDSSPGGSPGDPTLAVPARDNWGGSSIGEAGQPIRIYQASSYSGWTDIRADMGGHIFQNAVAGAAGAVLTANRAIYGYPLILSNELFSAWLGNRDAGAAFGLQTGTPAYFDSSTTTAPYTTLGTCNPATGPASAFCRAETAGAAAATCSRTIKTRTCVISGTNVLHYDARDQSRYYGGSCDQSGGITVSTTGPGPFPAAPAADPSACGFGSSPTDFYSVDNRSCAFQGTTVVEGSSPPLYTAAQCQGYARPVNTPDTAHPVNGALTTTACTPGGASGSYYSTCSDNADPNQTCAARFGGACNNNSCSNRTNYTETCVGGAAGTTAYYRTYQRQDRDDFLYHDCVADNATAGNPSNGYMRTAGVAWNTAYNTNAAGATASYVTAAGSGVGADASKNIDLYSVNYLNWKFGPKGPNGHPIGRKTRIQIAKDALSILVGNTNGIRLGLEVFNKTANAAGGFKAEGGNIARKVASMGARNCGVTSITGDIAAASEVVTVTTNPGIQQDDVLTIAGAGTAGGPLTATVVGIKLGESSSTYFVSLDAAASTTVVGATITLPACSGASTDTHNPTLPDYCPLTDPGCTRNSDWAQFNNRAGLVAAINAVVAASRTPLTESLYEAYLYFAGQTPKFGTSTITAQAGGAISAGRDTAAVCSGTSTSCPEGAGKYESPMLTSIDPSTNAPGLCQKNHVILITDGGPEDDYSTNAEIKALNYPDPLTGNIVAPLTTTDTVQSDTTSGQFESGGTPYGPQDGDVVGATTDGGYIFLDEMAYYMSRADVMRLLSGGVEVVPGAQTVFTHTIGFAGANTPVLKNAATLGLGSNHEANSSAELSAALEQALAKIFFFSPQGSAATVPISALNRSENADDVYLAFFAPDASQAWNGTLKKYKLGAGAATCGYADPPTNTQPIELCLTGRTELTGTVKNIEYVQTDLTGAKNVVVNPNAVSFWSDEVDGAAGDKGGTGLQLVETVSPAGDDLKPYTRRIYTFITDPGAASEAVSTSADLANVSNKMAETNTLLTKTRLGNAGMTNANRAMLINFMRGGSPTDSACSDSSAATNCTAWRKAGTRDWGHSDVVHSKPAVFSYDPTSSPIAQYVFYLSSDGLLHAVAGYPDDANSGGGKEKWAFMVEEALPVAATLKADSAGTHVEVADGSPVIYFRDLNGNGIVDGSEKVYLVFGLRRGGRAYYGLDITNIDAPQFMWKITPTRVCVGTSCTATTAFAEMGDTWSNPAIGRIRARPNPVMIFGGGYDTNQDYASSFPPTADSVGRAVYVADLVTAELVKAFQNGADKMVSGSAISGMDHSIPSDVAALNTDLDGEGLLDRLYVGDSGGQVWRFDVNHPDTAEWTARIIARVSGVTLASPFPDEDPSATPPVVRTPGTKRKIMYPPVAVKQQIEFTNSSGVAVKDRYDAVYIGTGDRENPNFSTSDDAMFMIKDYDIGLTASNTAPATIGDMLNIYDFGVTCSGTPETCSQAIGNSEKELLKAKLGWYYPLKNGEKVTASPTVFRNVLRFSTFTPNESLSSCLPSGRGVLYAMGAEFGESLQPLGLKALMPTSRQYVGFSVRGFIPTGTVLIRDKNIYVVHIAEGRLLYQKIGTVGGASKIYWYREQAR